jgi:hypothetical protein
MLSADQMRNGLVADLGPAPSFVLLMMVDAAVSAAERLQASGDPQWHRVLTETLQLLHQSKPRTHVLAADDPWIVALEQAFGAMEGRIAINDVWKLLRLSPLSVDREGRMRLGAVMYHLGWQRRLLRFNREKVGRGFMRGRDPRTIWVHVCPVSGQITHIGHDPAPSAQGGLRIGS